MASGEKSFSNGPGEQQGHAFRTDRSVRLAAEKLGGTHRAPAAGV